MNNVDLKISEEIKRILTDMTNQIQEKRPNNANICYDFKEFAKNYFKNQVKKKKNI
jgi:hypothetical protein